MTNEEFQALVLQQLQSLTGTVKSLESGQQEIRSDITLLKESQNILATELMAVKTDVQEVKSTVTRFENDITPTIGALFDGYSLRGDQIKELRTHVDERFDSIEADTAYLVSKVSGLERLVK